jgi:hypothetical protein
MANEANGLFTQFFAGSVRHLNGPGVIAGGLTERVDLHDQLALFAGCVNKRIESRLGAAATCVEAGDLDFFRTVVAEGESPREDSVANVSNSDSGLREVQIRASGG